MDTVDNKTLQYYVFYQKEVINNRKSTQTATKANTWSSDHHFRCTAGSWWA